MKVEGALLEQDVARAGAAAADLERQGFDAAYSFEGPHDPFLPLVLAARETRHIELGTSVAIAFARNPMTCAQIGNDLQLLTGGRFLLGLGSQIKPHIEKRFSQAWSRPAARMREFVLAVRAIWRCWHEGEPLDFRGEFYTHTLMTPFFDPGPNPHGRPPIFLAGVGPRMIETVGEVADGFFVHPFHTPDYLREVALPSLEKGLARGGRRRSDCQISCQTIVMLGADDEQVQAARQKARAQISFYASTPAYKGVLDQHGWSDLQPRLNHMSKQGRWAEMVDLVGDEMLDAIGVSGTPAQVGARLRERNHFADRSALVVYNESEPEAVADVVRALKGEGA